MTDARTYAINAHGNQRYGTEPYINHLDEVAAIFNEEIHPSLTKLYALPYLHDILEDTSITFEELEKEFGTETATLVKWVTDEPGPNRRERKRLTNEKLKNAPPLALILKAADRLANVRRGNKNDMYAKEHHDFTKAAYRPGLCDNIWQEINQRLKPTTPE